MVVTLRQWCSQRHFADPLFLVRKAQANEDIFKEMKDFVTGSHIEPEKIQLAVKEEEDEED